MENDYNYLVRLVGWVVVAMLRSEGIDWGYAPLPNLP